MAERSTAEVIVGTRRLPSGSPERPVPSGCDPRGQQAANLPCNSARSPLFRQWRVAQRKVKSQNSTTATPNLSVAVGTQNVAPAARKLHLSQTQTRRRSVAGSGSTSSERHPCHRTNDGPAAAAAVFPDGKSQDGCARGFHHPGVLPYSLLIPQGSEFSGRIIAAHCRCFLRRRYLRWIGRHRGPRLGRPAKRPTLAAAEANELCCGVRWVPNHDAPRYSSGRLRVGGALALYAKGEMQSFEKKG